MSSPISISCSPWQLKHASHVPACHSSQKCNYLRLRIKLRPARHCFCGSSATGSQTGTLFHSQEQSRTTPMEHLWLLWSCQMSLQLMVAFSTCPWRDWGIPPKFDLQSIHGLGLLLSVKRCAYAAICAAHLFTSVHYFAAITTHNCNTDFMLWKFKLLHQMRSVSNLMFRQLCNV